MNGKPWCCEREYREAELDNLVSLAVPRTGILFTVIRSWS